MVVFYRIMERFVPTPFLIKSMKTSAITPTHKQRFYLTTQILAGPTLPQVTRFCMPMKYPRLSANQYSNLSPLFS